MNWDHLDYSFRAKMGSCAKVPFYERHLDILMAGFFAYGINLRERKYYNVRENKKSSGSFLRVRKLAQKALADPLSELGHMFISGSVEAIWAGLYSRPVSEEGGWVIFTSIASS